MEIGRSVGELLTIIKAAGGTIQICSRFYSLYFAETDRMGRAGPNLFESAPKFPREIRRESHQVSIDLFFQATSQMGPPTMDASKRPPRHTTRPCLSVSSGFWLPFFCQTFF